MPAKKTVDVIPRTEADQQRMESAIEPRPDLYAIMDELIEAHHGDLAVARIALVWRYGWKADPDGRLVLGKFKKASSMDVQLHGYDAIIMLNHEAWHAIDFTDLQKRALLDHELCHGALAMDKDMEPAVDPNTLRLKYRTRKHDMEEFRAIVERYGLHTWSIEAFAASMMKGAKRTGQMSLLEGLGGDEQAEAVH